MSTTSAEEALQKAREIAARLTGGGGAAAAAANSSPATTTTSPTAPAPTTSTTKRKRWGVAPASNEATGVALPGLEAAAKKLKQQEEPVSKRMWVSTTKERPESHYFVYLPSRILDLVDKIGADGNDEKVTIQLKGRGSSREPPLPGIPEEPMHILIKGNPALVERAELMVDSLLQEADVAPVEELEPLDENAQSMALTVQHQQRSSGYTPATVAQLIHHNPALAAVANGGPLMEEEMKVPNGIVGYLIGRGGETINMLQAKSGCKMQIQKEMDLKPGATERIITLQAASQASIDDCRQMIQKMVDERVRAAGGHVGGGGGSGGGGVKDGRVADALAHGHSLVKMDVPDADVGLIIGKGGSTIKGIQESTGSQVQIPAVGNPDNPSVRTISITCPTQEGAESAKSQIQNVLNSKPTFQERVEQVTIQIPIPDRDVGLCIGRGGSVIKEMQHRTNTRIQIPSQPIPGQPNRIATISGTKEGCEKVRAMIERIGNEQSSAGVMFGHPPQQHGGKIAQQQQQQQQQRQQQETSPEWQAYYAAQALAQQNQQAAAAAAAAAPAPAKQGADAYYEQFFRYAYYYGEDAARQYYGAWSPPPGTPNPYGVNPAGITSPPAQQAPSPGSPAAAAADPGGNQHGGHHQAPADQEAKESSVRKVSNLPAWMTRGG